MSRRKAPVRSGPTASPFGVVFVAVLLLAVVAVPTARPLLGTTGGAVGAGVPRGFPVLPGSAVRTLPSALGSPGPAAAAGVAAAPTWMNVTRSGPNATPPVGYGQSLAYDPVDHVTVLFGGCFAECPSNQTWVFANGTWRNITVPGDAPPARDSAAMDFDPNMNGVLLFGGSGVSGPLGDTWLFRGGFWTNLSSVGPAPSARYAPSMAFDPQPEENGSVLYGGCVAAFLSAVCSNDTWVWQSWSGWVRLNTSVAPPAVGFAAMAYDPVLGAAVLFGGCAGVFCAGESNQTWELYSGEWWPAFAHGFVTPNARSGAGLAFDPVGERLLLFGGLNFTVGLEADTWSLIAAGWTLLSPSTAPAARADFGFATDPTGTAILLVGGELASANVNDTWAWESPPAATFAAGNSSAEVTQSVTFSGSIVGGTAPFRAVIAWGDGSTAAWNGTGPIFSATHIYDAAGTYVATVNTTDSAGVAVNAPSPAVTVAPGPAVSIAPVPAQCDVGYSVAFHAAVTAGGTAPFTYAWSFGDGTSGGAASVSHSYAFAGTFTTNVTVTDAVGATATSSVPVVVVPTPTVSISATPTQPNVSTIVLLDATVTGGTGPLTYSWTFGDGNTSFLPTPAHQFLRPGSYLVQAWVNDSQGASAHASTTVVIAGGSGSTTGLGSLEQAPSWFWAGLGAILAVGAIGSVLLLRRSRWRSP